MTVLSNDIWKMEKNILIKRKEVRVTLVTKAITLAFWERPFSVGANGQHKKFYVVGGK